MAGSGRPVYDYSSTVTFIGAANAGKSRLVQQMCEEQDPEDTTTIAVDFKSLIVPIITNTLTLTLELNICDTSGQPRFGTMTTRYYHQAQVLALVVDATQTLAAQQEAINNFCQNIRYHAEFDAIPILVVNKWGEEKESSLLTADHIDAIKAQMKRVEDERHAKDKNYVSAEIASVRVSARNNVNIGKKGLLDLITRTALASLEKSQKRQKPLAPESKAGTAAPVSLPPRQVVSEEQITEIESLFEQAIGEMNDDCWTMRSGFTRDHATSFKKFLKAAQTQVLADLKKGTITYDDAHEFASSAKTLAEQVGHNMVTGEDISNFLKKAEPAMKKSEKIGQIVGAIIGAALGVFIGVMIATFAPPAGAFAALALGKAGAIAGAAVGGLVVGFVGNKLGGKFTRFFPPAARMARAATGVEKNKAAASLRWKFDGPQDRPYLSTSGKYSA